MWCRKMIKDIKSKMLKRKIQKAGGIIPAIKKGIIGYHIWDSIKKIDGKYLIEIDAKSGWI